MKKIKRASLPVVCLATAFTTISCISTPRQISSNSEKSQPASPDKTNNKPAAEPVKQIEISQLQKYQTQVSDVMLTITSTPKVTSKNKPFDIPYSVKAAHQDGSPVSNFAITVSYPASKVNDTITFAEKTIMTDGTGIAVFLPPPPSMTVKSLVRFFPSFDGTDSSVTDAQFKSAVTAPWIVKTNLVHSGGTLALVDFDQNGKPITNNSVSSSYLLMNLMQNGFTRVGNADFTSSVVNGTPSAIYKAAKALLGETSTFLIYGTIMYESPVIQTESGYVCTLTGTITCMDMANGTITYEIKKTVSATDPKQWNVLTTARKALSTKIAESVIYGM
jgi:hypothetical protein